MFGSIGGAEILMILALALLLFGPRRLPQMGRTIGRAMSEFRKATNDLKSSLEHEVHVEELKNAGSEISSVRRDLSRATRDFNPVNMAKDAMLADPPKPKAPAGPETVAANETVAPADVEPARDTEPASDPAPATAEIDDGKDGRA